MEKFENFNELILALMLWITSNTNYITPKQTPNVEFIEQSKLSELACGNRECEIMAYTCLLYTSPSPRDATLSRMPSSA